MKNKIIPFVQFLIISAIIGGYVFSNYRKKYPIVHLVSEEKSNLKYDIQFFSHDKVFSNNKIEVLLSDVYESLKVDNVQSDIYRFNEHDCTAYFLKSPYAFQVLQIYKDVFFHSKGLYDPTLEVFLRKIRDKDSIIKTKDLKNTKYKNLFLASKPFIGFDYVMVNHNRLKKLKPGICLNLDPLIYACQAKNLSDLLKANSIDNFYFILNHEIVTSGFRDGRKKFWNVVYSTPVEINSSSNDADEDNKEENVSKVENKIIKVIFQLNDKAISVLNNNEELSSLENFYIDDLKEFETCEAEMKHYIKQCKFVFYKNNVKKNKGLSLKEIVLSKIDDKNKKLYSHFFREEYENVKVRLNNIWVTNMFIYEPFANYSTSTLCDVLNTCSLEKKIEFYNEEENNEELKKIRSDINNISLNFLVSEEYKKRLYTVLSPKNSFGKNKIKFADIRFEKSKNVLINPNTGDILYPKYICGFVISDNAILSRCLSLSCSMNNFARANAIFDNFKKHQCDYFVLYQDEDKNLRYKSSKQLKVKIDNYRYLISL